MVNGRLPLIEEYEGLCLRRGPGATVNERSCNHGYARGVCDFFPADQPNGANRYSLVGRSEGVLTLLLIEEEEYTPASSRTLHFSVAGDCLLERDIEPGILAQALAFCRSHLRIAGSAGVA
jgi:hypothetical protein